MSLGNKIMFNLICVSRQQSLGPVYKKGGGLTKSLKLTVKPVVSSEHSRIHALVLLFQNGDAHTCSYLLWLPDYLLWFLSSPGKWPCTPLLCWNSLTAPWALYWLDRCFSNMCLSRASECDLFWKQSFCTWRQHTNKFVPREVVP